MDNNKIYIKNMVCPRCIMVVSDKFKELGIEPISVDLGVVTIEEQITPELRERVKQVIEPLRFELIDDRRTQLVESVKSEIIKLVHKSDGELEENLSTYLSRKLNYEYNHISTLFSEIESTTIEQYYIAQKIERVKELLVYDELTLSEIAHRLNYSSSAHLSNQFKRVTGLTPSHFRQIKDAKQRKSLDEI